MRRRKILALTLGAMLLGWPAGGWGMTSQELSGRLNCLACHSLAGQGGKRAPAWDGLGNRLSAADLRRRLCQPSSRRMPSFAFLRPQELEALIAHLQSL